MPRSWLAALSGALVTGVLLTGCGGVSPGPPAGSEPDGSGSEPQTSGSEPQTTAPPDGTAGTTSPEIETSGTESTGPTETGQAADTPRLPIGGNTQFSGEAEQCAEVSFLGQGENSIPPGVSIVVTDAVFSASLFEVGGSACDSDSEEPLSPCLDGFVFTADDTSRCAVPVRTDVTRPDAGDDTHDQLRLSGRLQCPAGQEDECHELAQRLDRDDQFIKLFPPVAESTGTTTESTETTTESTETTTESTETTTETETSTSETTPSGAGN